MLIGMTLHGIFVPLITPFDAAGGVALGALELLAHEALDAGAAGLVALGTTAEAASLNAAEQEAVVDVIAAVSRERGTALLVGTRPDLAARPEVTAALSLVPPFVRPGQAGVIAHFEALAGKVPLIIYHVPNRTGQELSAATIRRLAGIPAVIGMKYATGVIDAEAVDLLGDLPDGFALLGGDDALISPLLALGAQGGILASAHVQTRSFVDLVSSWQAGDHDRARALGHRLGCLARALFAEPNPTVIKGVLYEQRPHPDGRGPAAPAAGRAAQRPCRDRAGRVPASVAA